MAEQVDWIRMIWDFRGAESEGTARHHAIHLKQFADKESIEERGHGHEVQSPMHTIAYIIVHPDHMVAVRDALRPDRATYAPQS